MHMISERRQEEQEMDLITIINIMEEDTTSPQRVRSMKIAREFVHAILLEIVSSPRFPLDTTTTTCCTTLENNDVCKETFILSKFVGFVRRSKRRRDSYDMDDHLIPLIKELVSQLTLENVRSTLHSISIDLFYRDGDVVVDVTGGMILSLYLFVALLLEEMMAEKRLTGALVEAITLWLGESLLEVTSWSWLEKVEVIEEDSLRLGDITKAIFVTWNTLAHAFAFIRCNISIKAIIVNIFSSL